MTAGTYNLVTYNATTGAGSIVFANGLTTLGNATLAVGATATTLTVGAGGLNHSVWSGASGTWDSGTNWTRNGVAAQAYVAGDFVTFNDAGTTLTVTSSAAVSPAMVTFDNSTKNYIINATISGTGTPLIKSGTGQVTLGGTNSYTGGTVLNAGQLNTTVDANLGTGGGITVNGNASWNMGAAVVVNYNRSLTVNEGAVITLLSGNNEKRLMGSLEGSGTVFVNSTTSFRFDNASNFRGSFRANTANSASYGLDLYSLRDEAGDGTISLENGSFRWFGSGGTKTFDDRQFFLGGNGSIYNRSPDNSAIVISTNLGQSGTGARTLTLGGNASAAGTFAGNIGDNGSSAVSVIKVETNSWTLSGTNTYSGITGPDNVTLTIRGKNALSPNSIISFDPNSGSAGNGGGRLNLRMDDAGVVALGNQINVRTAQTSGGVTAQWIIDVGNNGGATTNSTLVLGKMNFASITDPRAGGYILNITGANGYGVQIGDVDLAPNVGSAGGTGSATFQPGQGFNPTTAPLTITGTVRQIAASVASGANTGRLVLWGTNTGNSITGAIMDPVDFPSNANAKALGITKGSTGNWSLTNAANTFSSSIVLSSTTTSAGTLAYASAGGTNAITFSQTTGSATLSYIGSGQTMSGPITANALTTGTITLDASGMGPLIIPILEVSVRQVQETKTWSCPERIRETISLRANG